MVVRKGAKEEGREQHDLGQRKRREEWVRELRVKIWRQERAKREGTRRCKGSRAGSEESVEEEGKSTITRKSE